MIDLLDNLLRQILIDQITDEAQVRFQPPDQDWQTYISNLVAAANPVQTSLNLIRSDGKVSQ